MPDTFSPEKRSEIMARIRSAGMRPEGRLGELLRKMLPGEEILERPEHLPGKPDFYLPRLRLAVFADGCFFHGCPKHLRMPASRRPYWERKIRRNAERDRMTRQRLRRMGISVTRVWEHELKGSAAAARRKIRRALARLRGSSR